MPANIPDLGAIHHSGSQFTHNVFATAHKVAVHQGIREAAQREQLARAEGQSRDRWATSATQTVNAGRSAYVRGVQAQRKQAATAAKMQAAQVKKGRAAPTPGAPPRTFAMGTNPAAKQAAKKATSAVRTQVNTAHGEALKLQASQFKTMQQQRNNAHGDALKFDAARTRTAQQAVNHAHGQAIKEASRKPKIATPPPLPPLHPIDSPKSTELRNKAMDIARKYSHEAALEENAKRDSGNSDATPASDRISSFNPTGLHVPSLNSRPTEPTISPHQFGTPSANTAESPGYITQDPSAIARHMRTLGGQFHD